MQRILPQFAKTLKKLKVPKEEADKVAIAFSGGPDSTALAALTAHWQDLQNTSKDPPQAFIVDHKLRPNSTDEAHHAANQARSLGLYASILTVDWQGNPPEKHQKMHAARNARYDLLVQACYLSGIKHLLTAHHANDQAETFLLRLIHASGLDGLSSISPINDHYQVSHGVRLLRPLLEVHKEDLLTICHELQLDFALDETNDDPGFLRNRLRQLISSTKDIAVSNNCDDHDALVIERDARFVNNSSGPLPSAAFALETTATGNVHHSIKTNEYALHHNNNSSSSRNSSCSSSNLHSTKTATTALGATSNSNHTTTMTTATTTTTMFSLHAALHSHGEEQQHLRGYHQNSLHSHHQASIPQDMYATSYECMPSPLEQQQCHHDSGHDAVCMANQKKKEKKHDEAISYSGSNVSLMEDILCLQRICSKVSLSQQKQANALLRRATMRAAPATGLEITKKFAFSGGQHHHNGTATMMYDDLYDTYDSRRRYVHWPSQLAVLSRALVSIPHAILQTGHFATADGTVAAVALSKMLQAVSQSEYPPGLSDCIKLAERLRHGSFQGGFTGGRCTVHPVVRSKGRYALVLPQKVQAYAMELLRSKQRDGHTHDGSGNTHSAAAAAVDDDDDVDAPGNDEMALVNTRNTRGGRKKEGENEEMQEASG